MKFPSSGYFKVVPLNSKGAFKALWASVRHSNVSSMDIFVEVSTSQIVTHSPTIPLRLDDVGQFVSLESNDVNEGEFDGNLEGDEFDEDFATLDENLIVIEEDGYYGDLVFASALIVEFNKVGPLDEDELNSWKTWESMVRYEKRIPLDVGGPNLSSLVLRITMTRATMTLTWFWYRDRTRRFISPTFQQAYQAPLGATAYLAYGFAEVHRTYNTEIQVMPQEVPPHYRNLMSNIRDHSSQSLEHVGYSHFLQQFDQPTQETQVGEQREEMGDGSTRQ
ncbi:hypothetical protein KSS87_012852 [Heliosperma pusillum]|nr:hypothetical protein KSS87_012852 [Heliosperma pusillum]